MANNRMILAYRPTGDAVMLGKRMSIGWYIPYDIEHRLQDFFERAEKAFMNGDGESQDDFCLALETGENQPHVITDWKYVADGEIKKILIGESLPYGKPECI